jgi:hypothetical protein
MEPLTLNPFIIESLNDKAERQMDMRGYKPKYRGHNMDIRQDDVT